MGGYEDISERVRSLGPGHRHPAPYGLVAVRGGDAVEFLQRLCSQDVGAMVPGEARPAAFLDPKGKLIAPCQVLRRKESLLLEVERGLCETLARLLLRYHFAEELEIEVSASECGAWMGGAEIFAWSGLEAGTCKALPEGGVAYAARRHGMCRIHYHAPGGFFASPPWQDTETGVWTEGQTEAFRICAGLPRMGVDADGDTLALEAGLDDCVSLDKGCYTGQEIVARIHTYGHVNRKLCLLVTSVDELPVGAELVESNGDRVGRVGSSAPVDGGLRVALGYVVRKHATPGKELRLREPAGGLVTVCGFGAEEG